MSRSWKTWAGLSAGVVVTGAFTYPVFKKYRKKSQLQSEGDILAPENLPTFDVNYKYLPQYGPNFKVGQCLGYSLPDFVNLNAVQKFTSRPSDIWVVSYPKSGTTWVQEIVYLLSKRKYDRYHLLGAIKDALEKNLDDRVPFIEFPCPGIATIDELESPRIIKSHLPLQLLPASVLQSPHVRIIYVTRNPRDVAVSLYHFMDMLTQVQMAENFGFPDFVEDFLNGDLPYSPYVAHIASYVKAADAENAQRKFLIVRYEDLKTNLRAEVDRIGKFLHYALLDEEDWKWLEHFTKFDVMKNQPKSNYSWFNDLGIIKEGRTFMRKGKVGDWKGHLSDEQVDRFVKEIEIPLIDLAEHHNPLK